MRSYFFASVAYFCCLVVPSFSAAQEIDLIPLETATSVSPSNNFGRTASRTVTVLSEAAVANQNAYVVQSLGESCSSCNGGVEFTSNSGAVIQNSYASPVTYEGNQQGYATANSYPQSYQSGYSTASIQPQYSTSNVGEVTYTSGNSVSYPSNVVSSPATVYSSPSCSSCSQSYSSYPQSNVVYQQSARVSYDDSNAITSAPQYSAPSSNNVGTDYGVEANYVPSSTYASSTYASSSAPQYSTSQMTYTSSAPISSSVPTTSYSSSSPSYSAPQPSYSSASNNGSCQPGLAQSKAVQAAQMGLQGHLGSGLGGARYEGVGWSNQSAQQAIEHCCYWGQRPTAQIGVSQGADGLWYACVLYY